MILGAAAHFAPGGFEGIFAITGALAFTFIENAKCFPSGDQVIEEGLFSS